MSQVETETLRLPCSPGRSGPTVLYVSFKYGDAERLEHGRFFNDMNEALLDR
jgi:hypothetical protein